MAALPGGALLYYTPAMLAFEVYLNREKLCVAGVGNDGVLTAIVECVSRTTEDRSELTVAGLISGKNEHVKWIGRDLRVVMKLRSKS